MYIATQSLFFKFLISYPFFESKYLRNSPLTVIYVVYRYKKEKKKDNSLDLNQYVEIGNKSR